MLKKVCRKGGPLTPLAGVWINALSMQNSMEAPKKLNIELPCDPEIPLTRSFFKRSQEDSLLGGIPGDGNIPGRRNLPLQTE